MKNIKNTITALLGCISIVASPVIANECGVPAKDGNAAISGVLNSYWSGTGTATAGSTSVTVGAIRDGSQPTINAGDLLLIVQMQGGTFNSSNNTAYGANNGSGRGYTSLAEAGNYEYVRATNSVGTAGGRLNFVGQGTNRGLVRTYRNATGSTTAQVSKWQLIRVPQFQNATITNTITAPIWDGNDGGIVAFDVAGSLTMGGQSIDVSFIGFRGGGGLNNTGQTGSTATDYVRSNLVGVPHGSKGEGINGAPYRFFLGNAVYGNPDGDNYVGGGGARGAPGNAGGGGTDSSPNDNSQNAGGGGGAGVGNGGRGGHSSCPTFNAGTCPQTGGLGGIGINSGQNLLFFGGGGGAGSANNAAGAAATGPNGVSGGMGGGAILVRTNQVQGTGNLAADGYSFNTNVTNDATGGGGGGGTIQFLVSDTANSSANINATARGGDGMSNTGGGASHGPGGGGGGGGIVTNIPMTTNVSGGNPGTTFASAVQGANYGAQAGSAGNATTTYAMSSVPGNSSGGECTPQVKKSFQSSTTTIGTANRLSLLLRNPNPTLNMTSVTLADAYPAGLVNAATPAIQNSCGGTVTAAAGSNSLTLANGNIPSNGSCTISVATVANTPGTRTNTIDVGGVTAGTSGTTPAGTLQNYIPTSASFTVNQGLTIEKTADIAYDPVNGLTNAKAIPGSYVRYSLTVTNPSSATIDANTIILSDQLPADVELITASLYQQNNFPNARGPFQFIDGTTSSGLSFTFNGLNSTTDSSSFSTGTTDFSYSPNVNANQVDPLVKTVRFSLFGSMRPNSSFTINFLARVK